LEGTYNSSALTTYTPERFEQELQREQVDIGRMVCSDELNNWANMTDFMKLIARYVTSNMKAETCKDVSMHCHGSAHGGGTGSIVRALCSKTRGCSTPGPSKSVITRSGCKPICNVELQAEVDRAICRDKAAAAVVDATKDYFGAFESFHYMPRGSVSKLINIRQGCLGLRQASAGNNNKAGELADSLCGRVSGTNIAVQETYVTMRWLCPVSCGCTVSLGEGCPRSCGRGLNAVAVDPCGGGLFPGDGWINFTRTVESGTCHDIDRRLRTSTNVQVCQIEKAMHQEACCANAE